MTNARHLSKTAEWGSTDDQLTLGCKLMGGRPDLDPASSEFWNKRVRARRIYIKRDDALTKRWRAKRLWLNPPGDPTGILVKAFYTHLVQAYLAGDVEQACYVAFSLDQIVTLQGILDEDRQILLPTLADFPYVIPPRRDAYMTRKGSRAVPSKNPSHSSMLVWLPPRSMSRAVVFERFWDMAQPFGAIHLPIRHSTEALVAGDAIDLLETT